MAKKHNDPNLLTEIKMIYAKSVMLLTDDEEDTELKDSFYPLLKFLNRDDKKNLYIKNLDKDKEPEPSKVLARLQTFA